jgi:hypothetical protein
MEGLIYKSKLQNVYIVCNTKTLLFSMALCTRLLAVGCVVVRTLRHQHREFCFAASTSVPCYRNLPLDSCQKRQGALISCLLVTTGTATSKQSFHVSAGTGGKRTFGSNPFAFSALEGVGSQHHDPATLPPGRTRYALHRILGDSQALSGRPPKILPPPGFSPTTVKSVANLCHLRCQHQAVLRFQNTAGFCLSRYSQNRKYFFIKSFKHKYMHIKHHCVCVCVCVPALQNATSILYNRG